ncbi:MAG: glycosyltransferase [Propionibacteriales bacterium]|nr:glycosyltransferase [Propionibacteriales bacterium]
MNDRPPGLSVLHVIVRAGATNSQYNEHCLPVLHERRISVVSLFPTDVEPPDGLWLFQGDGTVRGSIRALRSALAADQYDAVHVHAPASGVLTLLVYLRSLRSRRDLVFTVHNSWQNFRRRNRAFLYLILFLYPTVVMCGAAAHQSLPRLLRGLVGPRLSVIPNGVDVERVDRAIDEKPDMSTPNHQFTVASVNRLIPLKDPSTVLQAFARVNDSSTRLVFVGDGPLSDRLRADVLASSVYGQVRLTGIIPRDDVYRLLNTADVFVSASGGEGLPVAVLEAMACGCPVILSDIPPHREIANVAPGVHLVGVRDTQGFARALRRVMAYVPAERRELGQRQRKCVAELFSVRAMNDTYRELYMQLMERNHKPKGQPAEADRPAPEGDDIGQLLSRMRARLGTCITLTVLGGLAGFGYAQVQAPEFQAMTSLIVGDVIGGPADKEALDASASLAATYADLARREPVLRPVAESGFAKSWQELQRRVHAQVGDKNPQLVQVTVLAPTAHKADELAAAVADQVVTMSRDRGNSKRSRFANQQLARIEDKITATQERMDTVEGRLNPDATPRNAGELADELLQLEETLDNLEDEYADMQQLTGADPDGAKVAILEHSYPSRTALRPDLIALVAAGAGTGLALAAGLAYLSGRRRTVRVDGSWAGRMYANGSYSGPGPGGPEPRLFDDLAPGGRSRQGGRS